MNVRSLGPRQAFEKKINTRLAPKIARNKELNKDITKVYFNGGKKEKTPCC